MTAELGWAEVGTAPVLAQAWHPETFESSDPDRVHSHLSEFLGPHTMDLPEGTYGFHARQQATSMPGVHVHRMTYGGTTVDLRPEPDTEHIVVIHTLQGRIGVSSGDVGIVAGPHLPVVLDAGKRYRTRWSRNSVVCKVVVDRALARGIAAEARGLSPEHVSLDFSLQTLAARPAVATWGRMVDILAGQATPSRPGQTPSLTEVHLAKATVSALLDTFPNAVRVANDELPAGVSANAVARAVSYIDEHAGTALTVREIARSVGLSSRALQAAFRRQRNVTPMEYARQVRLRRAYEDLAAADAERTTVAAIAARWGYHNPGRFAADFRVQFGRYPKEVLAQ
ncbi:AraC family transcriptional regulator [Mycolicibacter hiberniae]|uniref:Uncharacterized protein n=1 Tax=Mycolicibacter hiberniae TaxID=29314 RepID=A0A7I7X081_9MYCO|nr:AraC family transcriptional regulator [Mycolicibacter hiberniae]MCV7085312.1 AraC family transcriptional regulator [Mycolicibacter hiberniae]ORV70351.1 hypothetical protein AWC09_10285 [Mycolicibacter hiberniae]BBZ23114.1 hypothetical protein MHIB_15320 [Mycolicibacter hiberniae]